MLRAEEEEVVEVRQPPLGAEASDVVDPLARGPLDLGDDGAVEEVRLAEVPGSPGVRIGHAWDLTPGLTPACPLRHQ